MKKFIVIKKYSGERLDKYLALKIKNSSRSQIKKMILAGLILVNGDKAKVHDFLKTNDKISLSDKQIVPQTGQPRPRWTLKDKKNSADLIKKIKIIAQEKDFLIIEKPAGLLVHPTEQQTSGTLVDYLISQYPELTKIGDDPQRPALIHRLDKDVSGLMLVPRNQDTFDYFKKLFKTHTITKKYIGLVYGKVKKESSRIDFPIIRSKNKAGLFGALPQGSDQGKRAVTLFKILKKYVNYTLLEIEILTGRTHQIRVHMLAYGTPIVGDKLYTLKKNDKFMHPPRIFLHANQLSFVGPTGEKFEFTSPLPKELDNIITALKH